MYEIIINHPAYTNDRRTVVKRVNRTTGMFTGKEYLFRDLIENTSELIQCVTPDGRFLYVNRAWCEALGYSENEVGDLTVFDIIHPDSRQHCLEIFSRLQSGQRVDKIETQFVAKHGRKIIVEGSIHCKCADEKTAHIQCIFRDVTERKRAERELKKLEALEASILSAIPYAIVGLSERIIIFANHAVEKVFGWKPEELIGKSTRMLYRDDREYDLIGEHFYSALQMQSTYIEEFPCSHKDGHDVLCRVSASVIGPELMHREIVVMYEDITEQKKMEMALLKSEKKYIPKSSDNDN